MPTNLWTKLESPWIPKIQQNFQPQLRSYHRKQRPSQVSPLCIYFTITFSPNIWNNQKLTSEHFPKNIQEMHQWSSKFPHLLYQLHVIQKQGSVFQLAARLTPEGRSGAIDIPQVVPIWGVEIFETHEGIIPKTILFLPTKNPKSTKLHSLNFNLYILFRNVLFLNPHHLNSPPAGSTWNWKDHGDFDGKGFQPWIPSKGWRYPPRNGWSKSWTPPPKEIDDLGVLYPYFRETPVYTKDAFFFKSIFLEKQLFSFEVPATNKSSKTDCGFRKAFLIVSDGFCSSPKNGENKGIFRYETIHTGKLTWTLKISQLKRNIIFHPHWWLWVPALNFAWKSFKILRLWHIA